MVKRHLRPVPGRPRRQVGGGRGGGRDARAKVASSTRRTTSRRASGDAATSRASGCASRGAPETELEAAWHDSRTATTTRSATRWCASSATPRRCRPRAWSEGDAQHGRRRGQAGLEDARGRAAAARRHRRARSRTSARARKSVAAFKLRGGMPIGLTVTLRVGRVYRFIDRLILRRPAAHARLPLASIPRLVQRAQQLPRWPI